MAYGHVYDPYSVDNIEERSHKELDLFPDALPYYLKHSWSGIALTIIILSCQTEGLKYTVQVKVCSKVGCKKLWNKPLRLTPYLHIQYTANVTHT